MRMYVLCVCVCVCVCVYTDGLAALCPVSFRQTFSCGTYCQLRVSVCVQLCAHAWPCVASPSPPTPSLPRVCVFRVDVGLSPPCVCAFRRSSFRCMSQCHMQPILAVCRVRHHISASTIVELVSSDTRSHVPTGSGASRCSRRPGLKKIA